MICGERMFKEEGAASVKTLRWEEPQLRRGGGWGRVEVGVGEEVSAKREQWREDCWHLVSHLRMSVFL